MLEIFSYIMAVLAIAYVVIPLLKKGSALALTGKHQSNKKIDLVHQRTLVQETKSDLEFDFQTGKLDQEDFESLSIEQDGILDKIENQIQALTGVSTKNLDKKLEDEIFQERKKIQPGLPTVCNNCGKQFSPHDKFCSNCGAKF
jgi:hypothetical protein